MSDLYNKVNSVTGRQASLENAAKLHNPPANCYLKTDDERDYWRELMKSKPHDSWTPAALSMAFQVLKLEMMIRRGQLRVEEFIEAGADIFHPDSIVNEYILNIAKTQRQQLTVIWAMGLTFTAIASNTTTARAAKEERSAIAVLEGLGNGSLPGFMAAN